MILNTEQFEDSTRVTDSMVRFVGEATAKGPTPQQTDKYIEKLERSGYRFTGGSKGWYCYRKG